MNFQKNKKTAVILIIVILSLTGLFNLYRQKSVDAPSVVDYSDFIDRLQEGRVREITLKGEHSENLEATYDTGEKVHTFAPPYLHLQNVPLFREKGVKLRFLAPEGTSFIFPLLFQAALILGIGFIFFYYRPGSGVGGRVMKFGQSKATLLDPDQHHVTFADVEGAESAKEDLEEVVDFLKHPERFENLGGKIPKGILLVGPPGTGKTLLAKAVAGEAGVPFIFISGSDFIEMFVGVGASRVRDLFRQAREHKPCIVFIDEIDAIGKARGGYAGGGGHDERDQTLNQLLVEMDGFSEREGIIVMAATNRVDVLDDALVRSGRFDRQVMVPLPDLKGREGILRVHSKKVPLSQEVSLIQIARSTIGFSGADLANLVNESALRAARLNKKMVDQDDFEAARDKMMMGAECRHTIMTEHDRRVTAFHEAGHALVAAHSAHSDPIHKATIVPRGMALGLVMRLPETDKVSVTYATLLADLDVALAGRISEELMFGEQGITTGASSDFKFATNLARKMVTNWGMSKEVGYLFYGDQEDYLGLTARFSDQEVRRIDDEIRKILKHAHDRTYALLTHHKDQLILLAETLLQYETLSGAEIKELLETGALMRPVETVPEAPTEPTPNDSDDDGNTLAEESPRTINAAKQDQNDTGEAPDNPNSEGEDVKESALPNEEGGKKIDPLASCRTFSVKSFLVGRAVQLI
jgi:cell division protease FtsH